MLPTSFCRNFLQNSQTNSSFAYKWLLFNSRLYKLSKAWHSPLDDRSSSLSLPILKFKRLIRQNLTSAVPVKSLPIACG